MTVYVDVVLLENLCMNYIILFGTGYIIKLKIRQEPAVNVKNEKVFFRLIKESFSHRRKTLVNGLENSGMFKDKEQIKQLLEKMNLETNVRGENLSINQFAELSNLIAKSI